MFEEKYIMAQKNKLALFYLSFLINAFLLETVWTQSSDQSLVELLLTNYSSSTRPEVLFEY
jgi:hypothetical protein